MPAVATDLVRNESLTNETQVTLSWTAPDDNGGSPITGYIVELKSGDNITEVGNVTDTSFTYTDVVAGGTYFFKVKAENLVGTS